MFVNTRNMLKVVTNIYCRASKSRLRSYCTKRTTSTGKKTYLKIFKQDLIIVFVASKFSITEKCDGRPLYLDAQATTPLVSINSVKLINTRNVMFIYGFFRIREF